MRRFCLIDVSNLVHRAKHGSSKRPVSRRNPLDEDVEDGDPAESEIRDAIGLALHVAFESMAKVYQKFKADHMVACFDHRPWRSVLYPEYKRHRYEVDPAARPDDIEKARLARSMITEAIDSTREFFGSGTNVTVLHHELIEADDFIARWIHRHPGDSHFIVSTDTDFRQLVAENVELYNGVAKELYTVGGVFYQDELRPKSGEDREELHGESWKRKLDKKSGRPILVDPRWDLFQKVMLGDKTDNITRAAPDGHGPVKLRPYYARQEGIGWDDLMGTPVGESLCRELYERNLQLVDLTRQPDEIKQLMDEVIALSVVKQKPAMIGLKFLDFCKRHRLIALASKAESISPMLSTGYSAP